MTNAERKVLQRAQFMADCLGIDGIVTSRSLRKSAVQQCHLKGWLVEQMGVAVDDDGDPKSEHPREVYAITDAGRLALVAAERQRRWPA